MRRYCSPLYPAPQVPPRSHHTLLSSSRASLWYSPPLSPARERTQQHTSVCAYLPLPGPHHNLGRKIHHASDNSVLRSARRTDGSTQRLARRDTDRGLEVVLQKDAVAVVRHSRCSKGIVAMPMRVRPQYSNEHDSFVVHQKLPKHRVFSNQHLLHGCEHGLQSKKGAVVAFIGECR